MSTGLGAYWDNLVKETEEIDKNNEKRRKAAQEIYERNMRERDEAFMKEKESIQSKYNFELTDEIYPAIQRLEGLAVNRYRVDDYSYQDSFSKVYVSVQHEVDLYEEGEESQLNKNSCRGAKNWLQSFKHLYKSY